MSNLLKNSLQIKAQIAKSCSEANRPLSSVQTIVVTKYATIEQMMELAQLHWHHFGENRVDVLKEKRDVFQEHHIPVVWHFLGHVQCRKVKQLLPLIDYLHSLDRLSLAQEIQKHADRVIPCFVQVNVSQEETKQGISPEELDDFIAELAQYDKISVIGLMTMAPKNATEEEIQTYFHQLAKLQQKIAVQQLIHAPCTELSMGMSQDYPLAIEAGATYIRIGTAFFK